MACRCPRSLLKKVGFLEDKERRLMLMNDLLDQKLMQYKNNRCCELQSDVRVAKKLNCALKKLQCILNATEQLNEEIRVKKNVESCTDCEDTRQELFEQVQTMLQRLQNCPGACFCGGKNLDHLDKALFNKPKDAKSDFNKHTFCGNIFKKIKNTIMNKKVTKPRSQESESSDDLSDTSSEEVKDDFSKKAFRQKNKDKKHRLKKSKPSDDENKKSLKETKEVKRRFKKYSSKTDVNEITTPKTKDRKRPLKKFESDEVQPKKTKGKKQSKVPKKKTKEKESRKRESLRKSLKTKLKDTKSRVRKFSERIDETNESYIQGSSGRYAGPIGVCQEMISGVPPLWIPIGPKCKKIPIRGKCKQLMTGLAMLAALLFWSPCLSCVACCYYCCCCHANC